MQDDDYLQFNCRNTLNDQLLEDVHVELEDSDKDWVVEHDIPIESLPYGETKPAYLLLPFPESGTFMHRDRRNECVTVCRIQAQ